MKKFLLVQCAYYMSRRFEARAFELDGRDNLVERLSGQTFDSIYLGTNGVLCQISSHKLHKSSAKRELQDEARPYRRVVKVASMPRDRHLPYELVSILLKCGYRQLQDTKWKSAVDGHFELV